MGRELQIDGVTINDESQCWVIAEIGHNHQGKLGTARDMVRAAKECGANAAKLQKRTNRRLYTRAMFEKPYDHENSFGPTYGEHREALEFGWEEYRELQGYAREIGITFFATPFDLDAADFLERLGVPVYKIASGDIVNIPLVKHVAEFGKPVIVSTGGANMEDVQRVYDAVMPINPQLAILQCTSGYPCAWGEMNLRVITTFRERFPDVVVGLSAHDNGIAMAVAAYVLGARIIEKHFTLNRSMKGTDHAFSLERPGMQKMVRDLERTRIALGDGLKRSYASERMPLSKLSKKLVAARALPEGHVLRDDDVAIKSPGDGLPPYELQWLIGRRLRRPLEEDENLSRDVVV